MKYHLFIICLCLFTHGCNAEILTFENNKDQNDRSNTNSDGHLPLSSLFAQSSKFSYMKKDENCAKKDKEEVDKNIFGPRYQKIHLALPMREEKEVGFTEEITFNNRKMTIKTLSKSPNIIEISNFLSQNETELIIDMATSKGLKKRQIKPNLVYLPEQVDPNLFDQWDHDFDGHLSYDEVYNVKELNPLLVSFDDLKEMITQTQLDEDENGYISFGELKGGLTKMVTYFRQREVDRSLNRSYHVFESWLWHDEDELLMYEELLEDYHERIESVSGVPASIISQSEPLKVIKNDERSFSHCEHDSKPRNKELKCCVYGEQNCRICRYATLLMFLNDVEVGGEVVFPLADNQTFHWENLKEDTLRKCEKIPNTKTSNLSIKPKRGTALLIFNHIVSTHTGWMGEMNPQSLLGGSLIEKGERWIAKMWINIIGDGFNDLRPWKMGTNWLSENNKNTNIIEEMRNDYFIEGESYYHTYRKTYKRNQTTDSSPKFENYAKSYSNPRNENKQQITQQKSNSKSDFQKIKNEKKNEAQQKSNSKSDFQKEKNEKKDEAKNGTEIIKTSTTNASNNSKEVIKNETKSDASKKPISPNFAENPMFPAKLSNDKEKTKVNDNDKSKRFKDDQIPLGPPKRPLDGKSGEVLENRLVKASFLLLEELDRNELEIIARNLHDRLDLACIPVIVNPIH